MRYILQTDCFSFKSGCVIATIDSISYEWQRVQEKSGLWYRSSICNLKELRRAVKKLYC